MSPPAEPLLSPTRGLWIGVGFVCAANVLLPLQDALSKDFVQALPVWQVLLARSLAVLALALLLGGRPLVRRLPRARRLPTMVVRALVNLAAWGAFYLALRELPLGQAITLYFVSPVIVALLAGPFLGERAGAMVWVAIALGFAGVALTSGALRLEFSAATGFGLLAAALWAVTMILLRAIAVAESTLLQVAVSNGVFVIGTGAIALALGWQADLRQTAGLALAGMAGGAGQYAIYAAAGRLSASTLAALEYGALPVGFALGWLFFAEAPAAHVWAGAALVLASGLAIVAAERRRVAPAGPPEPVAAAAAAPITDAQPHPLEGGSDDPGRS
ncbi:DMT family transporter [Albimonas sp. CAU 1670]|uniref:DMT family transporter n=1 Tax=Albimonas sp. CAU 1670 TaxID=3032599 RepID=UPI0023DCAC6B|nr:DMT family transporter [Albimonas sp. CAU 1670]MDF2235271.1 DMT family transporter [Albimonas sp. CAU 1670]